MQVGCSAIFRDTFGRCRGVADLIKSEADQLAKEHQALNCEGTNSKLEQIAMALEAGDIEGAERFLDDMRVDIYENSGPWLFRRDNLQRTVWVGATVLGIGASLYLGFT